MQFNKKFFLLAFIHWGITLFFEKSFFIIPLTLKPNFLLAKIITIVIFWQLVAYIINRYKQESQYRQWIRYSAVYFIFLFFILLLIWPGSWYWDELEVLKHLRVFSFEGWQHILTGIFYLVALFLFPTPVAIVILQIFCISLITGYFVYIIRTITHSSRLAWFAYIPFLLIPVIHQNYSTYRATLFSYLILFFMTKIAAHWYKHKKISTSITVYLALIAAVMSTWRGEGLYFIVLTPLLYISALWVLSTRHQKIIFIATLGIGVLSINYIQEESWNNKYVGMSNQLTTYVIPLAALVKQAQQDKRTDLLNDVDEILDIKIFNAYSTARDAYWSKKLTRDAFYEGGQKKLIYAYLNLIRAYPSEFLQERWQGFRLSSTELMKNAQAIFRGEREEESSPIFQNSKFSNYIDQELRENFLNILTLTPYPAIQKIIHDTSLPIGLLLLLTIYFLITKRFVLTLISCSTLPAAFLAFLSIPESFFMYFFSSYLFGYTWFTAVILVWLSKKFYTNKSSKNESC